MVLLSSISYRYCFRPKPRKIPPITEILFEVGGLPKFFQLASSVLNSRMPSRMGAVHHGKTKNGVPKDSIHAHAFDRSATDKERSQTNQMLETVSLHKSNLHHWPRN